MRADRYFASSDSYVEALSDARTQLELLFNIPSTRGPCGGRDKFLLHVRRTGLSPRSPHRSQCPHEARSRYARSAVRTPCRARSPRWHAFRPAIVAAGRFAPFLCRSFPPPAHPPTTARDLVKSPCRFRATVFVHATVNRL